MTFLDVKARDFRLKVIKVRLRIFSRRQWVENFERNRKELCGVLVGWITDRVIVRFNGFRFGDFFENLRNLLRILHHRRAALLVAHRLPHLVQLQQVARDLMNFHQVDAELGEPRGQVAVNVHRRHVQRRQRNHVRRVLQHHIRPIISCLCQVWALEKTLSGIDSNF